MISFNEIDDICNSLIKNDNIDLAITFLDKAALLAKDLNLNDHYQSFSLLQGDLNAGFSDFQSALKALNYYFEIYFSI